MQHRPLGQFGVSNSCKIKPAVKKERTRPTSVPRAEIGSSTAALLKQMYIAAHLMHHKTPELLHKIENGKYTLLGPKGQDGAKEQVCNSCWTRSAPTAKALVTVDASTAPPISDKTNLLNRIRPKGHNEVGWG